MKFDIEKSSLSDLDRQNKVLFVMDSVANFYSMDKELFKVKTRKREVVLMRQVAAYLMFNKLSISKTEIGYYFGNQDHSNIIHSINQIGNLMYSDKKIKEDIEFLSDEIDDFIDKNLFVKKNLFVEVDKCYFFYVGDMKVIIESKDESYKEIVSKLSVNEESVKKLRNLFLK